MLRLNEDGTFDPYTRIPTDSENAPRGEPDLQGILGRGGCWNYRDETLLLAPDRPENANPSRANDILLMGKLDIQVRECLTLEDPLVGLRENNVESKQDVSSTFSDIDVHLSIPQGEVSTGRFTYPKKHKAFFDEPILFKPSTVGTFYMNQLLGNLNARLKKVNEGPAKAEPKFKKQDFYNRTFYLTTAPHPVNPSFAELDVHYDESVDMIDFRVMPITFHPNNTFTATGTEKVLRGRFEITGDEGNNLYFRVSLFGFGRSAPGSVFSEGRLLSQDDRRAYLGTIQAYQRRNQTELFVEGDFYYGFDKAAKKANSMGTFTLQEVSSNEEAVDDDEEEDTSTSSDEIENSQEDIEDIFQ